MPASQGGNASRISLSLSQPPPGTLCHPVLPLRPRQWGGPGPPRAGLRWGPVTQGSVRRRQDVGPFTGPRGISLSCYRPHNCWPSLVGGSGCGWRVRGSCAGTCMKLGLTGHLCLPRGGGGWGDFQTGESAGLALPLWNGQGGDGPGDEPRAP